MAADFSKTSLADALGLKPGMSMQFIHAPAEYFAAIGVKPLGYNDVESGYDFIHAFYTDKTELESAAWLLTGKLHPNGILWVSWPVKSPITVEEVKSALEPHGVKSESLNYDLDDWQSLKFSL